MAVSAAESGAPAVEAHELYRFFHDGDDETFALRGVSISVRRDEMVAVVGPSGSGKSTLLACLAGLDEPDGGWVAVAGHRITRRSEAERAALRGRHVGILMQSGNLLPHLSVAGNVAAAQLLAGNPGIPDSAAILGRVGLTERASALPPTLSGGEASRAALAVALSTDPALILADEPTGEVDADNEHALLELLRERARDGAGVMVVTHSERVAAAADRVIRLVDGRVIE